MNAPIDSGIWDFPKRQIAELDKITIDNMDRLGFKQAPSLKKGHLEYNKYFANDCSLYFDTKTNEIYFEDSGYTCHRLYFNSISEFEEWIGHFEKHS